MADRDQANGNHYDQTYNETREHSFGSIEYKE